VSQGEILPGLPLVVKFLPFFFCQSIDRNSIFCFYCVAFPRILWYYPNNFTPAYHFVMARLAIFTSEEQKQFSLPPKRKLPYAIKEFSRQGIELNAWYERESDK